VPRLLPLETDETGQWKHIANRDLSFICRFEEVEVVDTNSILTHATEPGQRLRVPLNSYEGSWVDPSGAGRVVLRYVGDPNGSQDRAAAVANASGNVVGVMPHPERATDELLGSTDGRVLLESFLQAQVRRPPTLASLGTAT